MGHLRFFVHLSFPYATKLFRDFGNPSPMHNVYPPAPSREAQAPSPETILSLHNIFRDLRFSCVTYRKLNSPYVTHENRKYLKTHDIYAKTQNCHNKQNPSLSQKCRRYTLRTREKLPKPQNSLATYRKPRQTKKRK